MNRVIHSRIYWSILLSIPVGIAGMLRWPFPDENALLFQGALQPFYRNVARNPIPP